jgi:hypothetical protein
MRPAVTSKALGPLAVATPDILASLTAHFVRRSHSRRLASLDTSRLG